MKRFLYRLNVPFQDTDMAGVVHYTRVLGYIELAEHACLDELGIAVISSEGGLPKVRVECDYSYPLRFRDEVLVALTLGEVGERSMSWGFVVSVGDRVCAEGEMVTAYVDSAGRGEVIPASWRSLLSE